MFMFVSRSPSKHISIIEPVSAISYLNLRQLNAQPFGGYFLFIDPVSIHFGGLLPKEASSAHILIPRELF